MIVTARRRRARLFLGSIKAPVPSSRPGIVPATARGPCQIRRFGGTGATRSPRLGASMARTHDLPRLARGATLWPDVVARHSVTAIAERRLNRGDGVQIEIDHLLKCRRGGAVAQAFGQGFEPRGAFGLDRDHLGQRVVPAPARLRRAAWGRLMVSGGCAPAVWRDERAWRSALVSAAEPSGIRPLGMAVLRYVTMNQWDQPAALKRSS